MCPRLTMDDITLLLDERYMDQALPKEETGINDLDIPKEFDSETNWPHCATVINDIRDQSNCGE